MNEKDARPKLSSRDGGEAAAFLARLRRLFLRVPAWGYLLFLSALWHVFLISHAEPNVFPDTGSFTALAVALRDGKWVSGFTFRTPGYPAFLYLIFRIAGWNNFTAVMVAQACLGATIPVLLYFLYLMVGGNKKLAFVGGLAFLFDRFSLGLETVPLSEFLCGYTVLCALLAFLYAWQSGRVGAMAAAGVVAGLNFLVRPTFQYVYPAWCVAALLVCWMKKSPSVNWQRRLLHVGTYLSVILSFVWAWSFVVWWHTGVFAPSLQLGASMTNHTGTMMELAPDEFATIRDMYVAEREKRGGDHINLFDQAGWKIAEATSCTLWQLSLKFAEINRYLILHYPGRYLAQVKVAWERIWTDDSTYITDITDPYATGKPPALTELFRFLGTNPVTRFLYADIENLVWANRAFLRFVPLLLLAFSVILFWAYRDDPQKQLAIVVVWGTINYHMLVHAMVQFTEFGRYKLPVQGLWFSYLIFAASWLLSQIARYVHDHVLSETSPLSTKRTKQ
jgi:hypothetical protein